MTVESHPQEFLEQLKDGHPQPNDGQQKSCVFHELAESIHQGQLDDGGLEARKHSHSAT